MALGLSDWASIATICGGVLAIAVLWYTARQVHQNTKVSRGQFWLELEKMFSAHDDVHLRLRPGGEWHSTGKGPSTPREWAALEDYMGLFEHCEILIEKKLIDLETFRALFSYRLGNIIVNPIIVNVKLVREKKGWKHFIRLLDRLDIQVPQRSPDPTLDSSG